MTTVQRNHGANELSTSRTRSAGRRRDPALACGGSQRRRTHPHGPPPRTLGNSRGRLRSAPGPAPISRAGQPGRRRTSPRCHGPLGDKLDLGFVDIPVLEPWMRITLRGRVAGRRRDGCSNPPVIVHLIVRVLRTWRGPATARPGPRGYRGTVIDRLTGGQFVLQQLPPAIGDNVFRSAE